jgi:hypothetical protein
MPEIGNVGGLPPQGQQATGQPVQPETVGQPGTLGQPTGIPVPGQGQSLPDVLAGRDASQMVAAERMREAGGASATEKLLGLNQQPSVIGAFAAPPGNSEALRHMSPTMRRMIIRGLVVKQRTRLRRLARHLRDEREGEQQRQGTQEHEDGAFLDELSLEIAAPDAAQLARARAELTGAARMLDLLDELLIMQDYALSQMGAFAQG